MNNTWLIYLLAIIFLWYVFSMFMTGCGSPSAKKKGTAKLYYNNQCGHCKDLMPYWLECKKNCIDKQVPLEMDEVDDPMEIPEDVDGFPTVDYTCDGKSERFVGGKNILEFLKRENIMVENFDDTGDVYTLYYADWCGYCKKLMPEWDRRTKGRSNFKKIEIDGVKDPQILRMIEGFPTMIIRKANGKTELVVGYDKIVRYLP